MPMNSIDRIRQMSQKGYNIGGSSPAPAPAPSPYGQPSGPMHDTIQQDFQHFTAPQPQPMLPPDAALNAPVQWEQNPLTGKAYAPKQRI